MPRQQQLKDIAARRRGDVFKLFRSLPAISAYSIRSAAWVAERWEREITPCRAQIAGDRVRSESSVTPGYLRGSRGLEPEHADALWELNDRLRFPAKDVFVEVVFILLARDVAEQHQGERLRVEFGAKLMAGPGRNAIPVSRESGTVCDASAKSRYF